MRRRPSDSASTPVHDAAVDRHAGALGRRSRPPLRGGLRRSQPDPHARAHRQAVRVPRRDRPRDVDQGAGARGAGEPAARLPSASRSRSASRSCCPRRVEFDEPSEQDREVVFAIRDATHSAASTAASGSRRSRGRRRQAKTAAPASRAGNAARNPRRQESSTVNATDTDSGIAERGMGMGLRALNAPRRLGAARPHRTRASASSGRCSAAPRAASARRPRRAARSRPRSSSARPARQATRQAARAVRRDARRRAADVPGGRARLRGSSRYARRRCRPTPTARPRPSCSRRPPSSASTCSACPRSSAA